MSRSADDVLLAAERLTIAYGGVPAVREVSFAVAAGESVAIVGASGSGKSTLLHAVAGLLPENGRIVGGDLRFRGASLCRMAAGERRRLAGAEMAMLFQHPGQYLNPLRKIGKQYVDFLRAHGVTDGAAARAEASLAAAGLDAPRRVMQALPGDLSGGMRQKVAAAMTLELNPALLLVDEPTAALDAVATRLLLERLRRQVAAGRTLLLVTHHLRAGLAVAERILVMQDGRIVADDTAAAVGQAAPGSYVRRLLDAAVQVR